MPRGRHRHSPPLHRLLPLSAIAGVPVVCALGPWVFSAATVLRALAAVAAATAVAGAVVMRRWDTHAGKQVADLTRARAGDEWRFEERVAELETDLEESRELRTKLERRLRAKRAELAGLRNEHAALLRRYATAETERASALEGRRLLEIEAGEPSGALALPPARSAEPEAPAGPGAAEASEAAEPSGEEKPEPGAVFSPEGSRLYLRAATALARFDAEAPAEPGTPAPAPDAGAPAEPGTPAPAPDAGAPAEPAAGAAAEPDGAAPAEPAIDAPAPGAGPATQPGPGTGGGPDADAGAEKSAAASVPLGADGGREGAAEGATEAAGAPGSETAGQEDEAQGKPGAAGEHTRPAAATTAPAQPAKSAGQQPAGHFTVPTAVAVVPAAPAPRPVVEGGFDFFGTHKDTSAEALDSVQNEDLADVVGQEALALHKAEAEAEFKTGDDQVRGAGQVIDLTAHDETEQIDIQGLRSAAS
ncbi:hypothetical protein [Streptomyces sp. NPDC059168]|uniref:hypothetical protein n=1 Tax=Streptomyces sp. NPDC059168 TaxID=3346753 RepID=UPI0036CEB86A